MNPLDLAVWFPLWALAATRLVGLAAQDAITETPRDWITTATDGRRGLAWVGYLVQCVWCTGIWVCLPAGYALWAWHGTWPVDGAVIGLALAQAAGMLSGVGRGS